jgi:hypothetical protein
MHWRDGLATLPHVTNYECSAWGYPQAEQMDLSPFSSRPISVFLSYAGFHYFIELRWTRHYANPKPRSFNDTHLF